MTAASIIVPTFRGRNRLPELLASLERQTSSDWELVFVIDGDVDGTEKFISDWRLRLNARVITFPHNLGRAAALSAGFEAAVGDILIRCDDDLSPAQDFVERHILAHRTTSIGVIGPCQDQFTRATKYSRIYGVPADARLQAFWRALPAEMRWRCWSANVSVTRETYERVGPYDTTYREYGWEDIDWGYRLHKLGIPIVILDQVAAGHRAPSTNVSDRAARAFASEKARATFESKHPEAAKIWQAESATLWNKLVSVSSHALSSEAATQRWCRGIDRVLPAMPDYFAEKAIALAVEGAAAGAHRLSQGLKQSGQ